MLRPAQSTAEQQLRWMCKTGLRIAVVVPCYNVKHHVEDVVATLPDFVSDIILVNDASVDGTREVLDRITEPRVIVLHLPTNSGVGGAVMAGFEKASELGADVIAKMDGDGQMDPSYLPQLIDPLLVGRADYAKGNRFRSVLFLAQMPMLRRIGNAVLSFLTKAASGYWNIFDPTNGYIAVRREIVEMLPPALIHRRYFFESSMLLALGLLGAVVVDVPMSARYGTEKSNLKISGAVVEFPLRLTAGLLRRLWLRKVIYSLTVEAVLGVVGILLILAGSIFGIVEFIRYALIEQSPAPAGTVMTAALPIFLGFQMVINALVLDIQSVPTTPICERLGDRVLPYFNEKVGRDIDVPTGARV